MKRLTGAFIILPIGSYDLKLMNWPGIRVTKLANELMAFAGEVSGNVRIISRTAPPKKCGVCWSLVPFDDVHRCSPAVCWACKVRRNQIHKPRCKAANSLTGSVWGEMWRMGPAK